MKITNDEWLLLTCLVELEMSEDANHAELHHPELSLELLREKCEDNWNESLGNDK